MSAGKTGGTAVGNVHEIDVCIKPPTNEIDNLKNAQGVTVENKVSTRKHYLGFNLNSDFFKNQTLRQAVACAINRDDINAAAYDGNGAVQYTDLNRGLPTFDESIGSYKYDLTRAKELMKEAGYENGFTCNLYVASDEQWPTMASVVQAQLKEIGITVNIVETETATHKSIIKEGVDSSTGNTVDMFIWRWNEDMRHPYTEGLFDSLPNLKARGEELQPIHGMMPNPMDLPKGCVFAPRCPYASDKCQKAMPPLRNFDGPTHFTACCAYDDPDFRLRRNQNAK